MNDEMLEGLVRARLRANAPHDVPERLVLRATAIPQARVRNRRWWQPGRSAASGNRFAVAGIALVAVLALGVVLAISGSDRPNDVAAPALPTLPAVTGPSLPPGAAHPTRVNDGAWVTPATAWLVDDSYNLRITTDGGLTWSEPRPLPHDDLRGSPQFLDGSNGVAVWAPQETNPLPVVVYITHDGGTTWSSVNVGTLPSQAGNANSLTVHFSDLAHGIVLGGDYLAGPAPSGHAGAGLQKQACAGWSTADGGATWTPLADPPCSDRDWWASPLVGIVLPISAGGPVASVTLDGGLSWRSGTLPDVGVDDAPFSVVFTVRADGTPRLAYRVDRGTASSSAPGSATPGSPSSAAGMVIVAESHDGGATWQEAYRFPDLEPTGLGPSTTVTALGPDHWIATGGVPEPTTTTPVPILETADGGRTWTQVGTLGAIAGVSWGWFDRLHGMALGQDNSGCALPSGTPCHVSGLFLTNDGGQTWHGVPF